MARSLAKIHEQIAKLQKEADAIQSGVIARMRREIAQHGLTAEHLFGSTGGGAGNVDASRAVSKPAAAGKPAKYADDQGNSWHGIGKRPSWIHAALEAGRSLEDFLVGGVKKAASGKKVAMKKVPAHASKSTTAAKKARASLKNSARSEPDAKKTTPKPTSQAKAVNAPANKTKAATTKKAAPRKAAAKKAVKAAPVAESTQAAE